MTTVWHGHFEDSFDERQTNEFCLDLEFPEVCDEPASVTYSDMYLGRVSHVPVAFRRFMSDKAEKYSKNGFGYDGKDYTSQLAHQIDINSNSDEATSVDLLNNDKEFVNKLNELIANATIKIVDKNGRHISRVSGVYRHNQNHGAGDNDVPGHLVHENGKSYIDILRKREQAFDGSAVWSIEIKSDVANKQPKSVHTADLVLLHILGTDTVQVYASANPRGQRADESYINIGSISGHGQWNNIRVAYDWTILPFK